MEILNGFRKLYTHVGNCVRNLKTLKAETSTYGCHLKLILKEKLSDKLLVIISRKYAGNVWVLDKLLEYFLEDLQATESFLSYLENQNTESEKNKHGFTANCFYSEIRELKVKNQDVQMRTKVTSINSKKEVWRKFSNFFKCMKSGHLTKNCLSKYMRHKCNQRHHVPICTNDKNKSENSLVTHVGVTTGILLQTTEAEIFNIERDEKLTTR